MTVFHYFVAEVPVASHEVKLLCRVLFVSPYRTHWVNPIPPRPCCFQLTLAVFLATPAPAVLRLRVHPLISFAPSPEYVTASHQPISRSQRAPSVRFFAFFTTSAQ